MSATNHTKIVIDQDYTSFTGVTRSLTGSDRLASFNNVTFKARLEHDLAPTNLIYALVATGFSPGDKALTQDALGNPTPLVLKAETLTSYEIGTKNRFLNNHVQVNLAAFYNDCGGYQTAGINVAPPGPIRIFETVTTPVKAYDVEFEVQARPWANGTFGRCRRVHLELRRDNDRWQGTPHPWWTREPVLCFDKQARMAVGACALFAATKSRAVLRLRIFVRLMPPCGVLVSVDDDGVSLTSITKRSLDQLDELLVQRLSGFMQES